MLGGFRLCIQSLYSLLVRSGFLFLHDSDLTGCMFLGVYPFFLGYPELFFIFKDDMLEHICMGVVWPTVEGETDEAERGSERKWDPLTAQRYINFISRRESRV